MAEFTRRKKKVCAMCAGHPLDYKMLKHLKNIQMKKVK